MEGTEGKKNNSGLILLVLLLMVPFSSVLFEIVPALRPFSGISTMIIFGLIIFFSQKSKKASAVGNVASFLKQLEDGAKRVESSDKSAEMPAMPNISQTIEEIAPPQDSVAEDSPVSPLNYQSASNPYSLARYSGQGISMQDFWGRLLHGKSEISLNRKKKYLQVALNGTLSEAFQVISDLPQSEKIIIEAGTPLIKSQGDKSVREIRYRLPEAYIVADIKTADLARREVEYFAAAGANAVTCLGVAPIETIDEFILACKDNKIDSMIDMMNVADPLSVLKKLKIMPKTVIVHRGVDETESSKGKMLPYYQINQIKGFCNAMVAVAGGDTAKEVQSAVFNGADIVVVWKDFMAGGGVKALAESFLRDIK